HAGQSGCDTQPDVPTLTCAPGAHVRKTLDGISILLSERLALVSNLSKQTLHA
ncbi:hypothetical protein Tco_0197566, partial [Tanacetum coccineum]